MTDDPRITHNAAALRTLLPLLETHTDLHGRIVSKALWISPPDTHPAGWVPPEPEVECWLKCQACWHLKKRCTIRDEAWAKEWKKLRKQYPELVRLEETGGLLDQLTYHNVRWRLAIYREYVQPWSDWHREKVTDLRGRITSQREVWAEEGVMWLAKEWEGWLPTYVPAGMPTRNEGTKDGDIIRLRIEGLSYHDIAKQLRCSKTTISAVLAGKNIPHRKRKAVEV